MGEQAAIDRRTAPVTVEILVEEFHDLGLEPGDTVLVHSSLSSLGWVCGGAPAVVDALMAVLTSAGTLAMPTHSTQYAGPAGWENPPVPDDWVETIRETMPPYRPELTPTRGMGAIPECFRDYPGVRRSRHPALSVAAWGADVEALVADHPYDFPLGEGSPLSRLYDADGRVLLLGVGHDRNTSLHLAEHRADCPKSTGQTGSSVLDEGERVWLPYEELDTRTDDFPDVGAAFEREQAETVVRGRVAEADSSLVSQRALMDFAVEWFGENRT